MLSITVFLMCLWILGKNSNSIGSVFRFIFFISLGTMVVLTFIETTSVLTTILMFSVASMTLAVTGFVMDLLSNNRLAQLIFTIITVVFSFYIEQTILPSNTEENLSNKYDPNSEIFIKISPEYYTMISKSLSNMDLRLQRAFFPEAEKITDLDDYYTLDLQPNTDIKEFISNMNSLNGIKWVEANENIAFESPEKIKNLSVSSSRSLSNDPSVTMQWHLSFLEMEKYYQVFKNQSIRPSRPAKLYILDTGIDGRHEDLPTSSGKNSDKQGHGTHCAGVAAALTNNGIGVASMAPEKGWIDIYSIQVIGDVGFGSQKAIIEGIIKAADAGADVISMSLGGITNQEREQAYNDAVKYANNKGAIVVVAAGNANLDGKRYSPANAENVIAVASVNEKSEKSGFSNYVQNLNMGIAAPGERILSTTPSNSYTAFNGTSMATPQVAGLIAVMKAIKPTLDTKTVYKILSDAGTDTQNTLRTGKLIHPYKTVQALFTIN